MEDFTTLPTVVSTNPNQKLQIIHAELTSDLSIAIDVINLGDLSISDITFSVKYKDIDGNFLFNSSEFYYTAKSLDVVPHKIYYIEPFKIDQRFVDARAIEVRIREITQSGGKTHIYDQSSEISYSLAVIPQNKQLKINNLLGDDIIAYGENLRSAWKCVCGALNPSDVQECSHCHRNKYFVLNNLTESLVNMKILNMLSQTINYSEAGKKALTENLTKTHLTKVAPTTDILAPLRINEDEKINKNNKYKFVTGGLLGSIILILLLIGFHFINDMQKTKNFEDAKSYLASGNYQAALTSLEKVGHSDKFETQPLIEKAEKLINSNSAYEKATSYMNSNNDLMLALVNYKKVLPEDLHFQESQEKITEIEDLIINKAKNYIENDETYEAVNLLTELQAILPESAEATSLLDSIKSSSDYASEYPYELSESPEYKKNRAEMSNISENLLHTYQKIKASQANLRSAPSIESEIITILPIDSDLYIKNTKIEGIERVWCEVEALDSSTGEKYEGWISNKVFEEQTDNNSNIQTSRIN